MEIQHAMGDGCLVVRFAGSIDLFSVSAVQRTLLKDLSQQPYGLICDLAGVSHLDPVCASVFATVANHPASRWPTTSFLLCNAQPAVAAILGRLQVPQFLCRCTPALRRPWTRPWTGPRTCAMSSGWPQP
jgi:anti-anti-sigma regulatory factor